MARIGARFARSEPRRTVRELLLGLLAPIERKNGWWLAEQAGHASPDRMQRLLRTAVWDTDAVAGDLRDLVVEHLGHRDGILVADETGYLKKGVCSVGVQRQYSGTAGRVENSQIGVFLAYVSPRGRALLDRRLYLPRSWSDDERRCTAASVPDEVLFATKPELALAMVDTAIAAGVPAGWFTADEAYGLDPALRAGLRERGMAYVLAVACNTLVNTTPVQRERVDRVAALLPEQAWQTRSAGPGSKGQRLYDWAWVTIHDQGEGRHSLLVRRGSDGQLAYYLCWTPASVPLVRLVTVAGSRWSIEESFQTAKGQVGLDQYQCRGWRAWHRFTLLAMIALALLTVVTIAHRSSTSSPELIDLTLAETRRLIATALPTAATQAAVLAWSRWRRRHQASAKRSHYRRRSEPSTSV
ncbi:IS701 family transposase [Catellatospora sp. NPDC049111]|uniref:IS701 family transposase n=1 Tax=Catellatospora sp. NPDC049111 TaxID=3155271 RepID=UPI0033DAD0AD